MPIQVVHTDAVHKTTRYSQAVRAGNTLYLAGQVALDRQGNLVGRRDIRAQTTQVFENIKAILESQGMGLKNLVKTTTFVLNSEFLYEIREVRDRFFGPLHYYPAGSFIVISNLATPDYLVEIEGIAVLE